MSINQGVRESAFDIYKMGYKDKKFTKETPQSKLFFLRIRTAMIDELEKTGFCELIDSILDARRGQLDIVVYSAIADIATGYEKKSLIDIESDSKYHEYVPYIPGGRGPFGGISWSECARIDEHSLTLSERYVETIRKARQVVRAKHLELVEGYKTPVAHTTDVLEEAHDEAKQIVEEANREAARIIDEAKLEASRINESAQITANTIIDDANSKASERSKESSEKLIEKYLASEQKRFKEELNEELSRHTAELLDTTKRAADTHTEMCDATNALQVKWVQTLDGALSQMAAVKEELYAHIHDWQVSLFPREIKPLAERYLELYRIINVDKLLREAILFQEGAGNDSIQTENSDGAEIEEASNTECPATVITGLQRLNKTLTTFLRRYEVALNGLDLYVFYPNVGDEFDDMWHIPDDEDEEYYGKRIKECVIPGIAKKANDDCGDDVLIPAVVKVEMEN